MQGMCVKLSMVSPYLQGMGVKASMVSTYLQGMGVKPSMVSTYLQGMGVKPSMVSTYLQGIGVKPRGQELVSASRAVKGIVRDSSRSDSARLKMKMFRAVRISCRAHTH